MVMSNITIVPSMHRNFQLSSSPPSEYAQHMPSQLSNKAEILGGSGQTQVCLRHAVCRTGKQNHLLKACTLKCKDSIIGRTRDRLVLL